MAVRRTAVWCASDRTLPRAVSALRHYHYAQTRRVEAGAVHPWLVFADEQAAARCPRQRRVEAGVPPADSLRVSTDEATTYKGFTFDERADIEQEHLSRAETAWEVPDHTLAIVASGAEVTNVHPREERRVEWVEIGCALEELGLFVPDPVDLHAAMDGGLRVEQALPRPKAARSVAAGVRGPVLMEGLRAARRRAGRVSTPAPVARRPPESH
eukprot:scaffold3651_cov61-Phaeocystis_antarctica.AAC.4